MPTYSIHFAKTHLVDLVARTAAGEEVVLARDGKPVVRLVPLSPAGPRRRRPGRLAGRLGVGPEFFEPLPAEELAAWNGG